LREGGINVSRRRLVQMFYNATASWSLKNEQRLVVPENKTMKQVCACYDMSQMQPLFRTNLTACPANLCVCVCERGF
jgi:hypothetical protein